MAKTNSDHVVKLSADFTDFVRQAEKASKKSSEIMGKALEVGVKSHVINGFEKSLKVYERLRERTEKKMDALVYAQDAKRAHKVAERFTEVAEKLAKLDRELKDKSLDAEVKLRKEAEKDLYKQKQKYLLKLSSGLELGFEDAERSLTETMGKITKEQRKATQAMTRTSDQMARGAERSAEFMKMFRRDATKGADDFNEKLGGALETFKSGLSDIDVGSMLSGGSKGVGKGLGGLSEMFSGLGASAGTGLGGLGGLATTLGAVLAVVGPLVIAFGLFAGVMMGIDKETKAFNKSAINTFGTRSVMNIGAKDMRENLRVLQHATADLNKTLGLTSDEAMGVFDALDAGGITLSNLTSNVSGVEGKAAALDRVLVRIASTSKSLGVSVNEFAGTMSEYTQTLGFSLENVAGQFANIAAQASDAGFSTRRFYSLITQASAGQASLNTHLDVTSQLLVRMAKTLGDKKAAETIGGAAGSFQDSSTQDRYKTIMTTGAGRTKKIIEKSASAQARSFASDFASSGVGDKIAKSIRDAGINFDTSTITAAGGAVSDDTKTKALVKQLAGMTRSGQAELIAAVTAGNPAMGRQLEQLVSLSRGTSGNMADMSDAMADLDPGATIAMKIQSAAAILGKPLNELTGVDRMAAESITGLSGEQMEVYRKLSADSEGRFNILQRKKSRGDTAPADQKAMAEQYGAIIQNGKIVSAAVVDGQIRTGTEVSTGLDLMTAQVEVGGDNTKTAQEQNFDLAQRAFDETVTISDLLQNDINNWLRGLYEDFGLPMIDMMGDLLSKMGIGGKTKAQRKEERDFGASLVTGVRKARTDLSTSGKTISNLEGKSTRTPEENAALSNARITRDSATAIIEDSTAALNRLSQGSDYDLMHVGSEGTLERSISGSGAQEADILRSRAATRGIRQGTAALATSGVAAAVPGTAAPGAGAAASTDAVVADHAEATSAPIAEATVEASAAAAEEHAETRTTIEKVQKQATKELKKVLVGDTKLGDALARSNLPDAIVAAQVKQQMAALAFAAGLSPDKAAEAVDEYMTTGTLSKTLQEGLGTLPEQSRRDLSGLAGGLGIGLGGGPEATMARLTGQRRGATTLDEGVEDFIYRGDGVRGNITPIDSADTFVGYKPGGPVDRASGGGNVSINIFGGDERKIFDVVKRVLQQSGIGPGRVASRA
jgi:hypothetical protein